MSDPASSPKHEQFMALFVRHEPGIHSFLTSLLGNLTDAEEVMQETSMAMWKKFEQFEAGTSFRNWAFQIAR
jgi:RNA polymerase sigma-70 factor (ECF subfamily)